MKTDIPGGDEMEEVGDGWMSIGIAPGKVVLFGEYSVMYGSPALAISLDVHTSCRVFPPPGGRKGLRVNGKPAVARRHMHILGALEALGLSDMLPDRGGLEISTRSHLPSSSGLGSSSSITASTAAALMTMDGRPFSRERCFDVVRTVERNVEGQEPNPLDGAAVVYGGVVGVHCGGHLLVEARNPGGSETPDCVDSWSIERLDIPPLPLVVGTSRRKGRSREVARQVEEFSRMRRSLSRDLLEAMTEASWKAVESLAEGDMETLGEAMSESHRLISAMGLNTPETQRLVDAVKRHSLGAKITGAGGGGS
ncbi:MAG: hypothetical protein J7L61_03785, partial [Thermoplasmata archaeon]|nr:hypothetical protein [Thermoplasmata archaeon]